MNLIDKWTAMQAVQGIDSVATLRDGDPVIRMSAVEHVLENLPETEPEHKTGHWILDRSGAYCCSKCMEPCAGYVMMKPRDKFCKMCGTKMDSESKE